jgi:hypothetical protein
LQSSTPDPLLRSPAQQSTLTTRQGAKQFLIRAAGRAASFAVLGLALFSTGCLFHKKPPPRAFVPPPPRPSKTVNLEPPPIFDPPEIVVKAVDAPQDLASIDPGLTAFQPPRPAPVARRPQPAKPAVAPPAAIETPVTPRIAQIFTPEQLRENNKILDESLERVQRALEALGKRNLTAEQRDRVEQIRDFQMQAKQAREEDLVTAVSLAKHADLLAKDLLDRLP